MMDLLLRGIGFAFIASFWAGLFFAGRALVRGACARRYFQCAAFAGLVLVLLWCGTFLGLTPWSGAYARYQHARNLTMALFGRSFSLSKPRLTYNSPRAFNGDGYSIDVYDLPEELARWATVLPPDFTTAFPIRPPVRSRWSDVHWQPTPFAGNDQKFLEFALMERSPDPQLREALRLLDQLAAEPGHYFSYFYNMHDQLVGDLDLFLFSPSKRVLIVINSNT